MSDWLSFGGGVLDTGLGLIRDHLNRKHQKEINEQNWQQEQQAATTAYERQLNIMNEYQTPMAQRRMLEEAGLNVGMMYAKGGGGMSGGGASVAKAQGASAQATQMAASLNIARQAAEISNIKADTAEKESMADLNKQKEDESQTYVEKMKSEINLIEETILKTVSEKEGQELRNAWQRIENLKNEFEQKNQQEMYDLEIKLKNSQITLNDYYAKVLQEQEKNYKALTNKYNQEARYYGKMADEMPKLWEAQTEYYSQEAAVAAAEAIIKGVEAEVAKATEADQKQKIQTELDILREQLDLLKFANDNKEFLLHWQIFNDAVGRICDVGNMASNFLPTRHIADVFTEMRGETVTTTSGVDGKGKPYYNTTKTNTNTSSKSNQSSKKSKGRKRR